MSGALRRNGDEILDALDNAVIKMRRAFKERSETQSTHIRRTTSDNRDFDGSHTDSDPGTGPGDHHGPSNGGNSGGSGSDPRLDGLVNDGTIHQRGDGRYQLSSEVRPHKPFAKNDNHSQREFDRQLGMQEAGMRDLTADEFFRNRNGYRARQRNGGSGRTDADLQAAERARLDQRGAQRRRPGRAAWSGSGCRRSFRSVRWFRRQRRQPFARGAVEGPHWTYGG